MQLNFGMPDGFAGLLAKKYDLMARGVDISQQDADTRRLTGTADAGLTNIRAGLLPTESAAQTGLVKAQTGQVTENTRFIAPLAQSSIALNAANVGNVNAQTGMVKAQTKLVDQDGKVLPRSAFGFMSPQSTSLGSSLGWGS